MENIPEAEVVLGDVIGKGEDAPETVMSAADGDQNEHPDKEAE